MKRNPGRVLTALAAAALQYPDQRIGQIIGNAMGISESLCDKGGDTFYVEDDDLALAVEEYTRNPKWSPT